MKAQVNFAHQRSLKRAYTLKLLNLPILKRLLAKSDGPDQTAPMRSLIRAFAFRTRASSFSRSAGHIFFIYFAEYPGPLKMKVIYGLVKFKSQPIYITADKMSRVRVNMPLYASTCEQQRFRRACASAQSRQNLCCSLR